MVARWNLGTDLASVTEPTGCPAEAGMDASLFGWQLCSCPKGGDGVGKTKVGKGAKVMAGVEGNGLPIGLHVASAQPHELTGRADFADHSCAAEAWTP